MNHLGTRVPLPDHPASQPKANFHTITVFKLSFCLFELLYMEHICTVKHKQNKVYFKLSSTPYQKEGENIERYQSHHSNTSSIIGKYLQIGGSASTRRSMAKSLRGHRVCQATAIWEHPLNRHTPPPSHIQTLLSAPFFYRLQIP